MSSLQSKNRRGYLAAFIGGMGGAILFLAVSYVILKLTNYRINFYWDTNLLITLILGTTCAEVIGCWIVLRWRGYQKSRTTAIWLTVLFIPGWIIYPFLMLTLGIVQGGLLMLGLLPLIARFFTNHPDIPNGIASALDTYAKRPTSY